MQDLILGAYYTHYKNKPYRVLDLARHSETLETLVVYEALYENEQGRVWVRPEGMFREEVVVDGVKRPRFALNLEPRFDHYHSHIYFEPAQRSHAADLHARMARDHSEIFQVHRIWDHPIGPHPLPMFEADFKGKNLELALQLLQANRGQLSVLVHPLSGDEILDHTQYAMFLGARQPLALDKLL
jgi:aromatic ring-cleaving dioxygenase